MALQYPGLICDERMLQKWHEKFGIELSMKLNRLYEYAMRRCKGKDTHLHIIGNIDRIPKSANIQLQHYIGGARNPITKELYFSSIIILKAVS